MLCRENPLSSSWLDAPVSAKGGRPAMCKRDALRGIFWILDNGAKWKNMPRGFGSSSAVHRWSPVGSEPVCLRRSCATRDGWLAPERPPVAHPLVYIQYALPRLPSPQLLDHADQTGLGIGPKDFQGKIVRIAMNILTISGSLARRSCFQVFDVLVPTSSWT